MKQLFLIGALLLGVITTTPDATAQAPAQSPARQIVLGETHVLQSRVMGDDREINVWLPPNHGDADRRFNVVYVLDGALDQDFIHIAGLGQLGALSWTYEQLIIVGVQTRTRIAELTPPATDPRYRSAFPNAGGAAQFRRFLAEEVIPFVEHRYQTGERRALMGESLAGLFVVDTLLNQPSLFNDYVAISPSLWWDDRRFADSAATLLARNGARDRRLYLAVANEGGTMQDGIDRLRAAITATPRGVSMLYADRSAMETHATILHPAALDSLRWLYPMPPYAGETPWYMIDGASPPPAASN